MLDGLLQIVCASQHKRKYCCLLKLLRDHRLLELPPHLDDALASRRFASAVNACLPHVKIIAPDVSLHVIYLEPKTSRPEDIGFGELARWLQQQPDALAGRFAASLQTWASVLPGHAAG